MQTYPMVTHGATIHRTHHSLATTIDGYDVTAPSGRVTAGAALVGRVHGASYFVIGFIFDRARMQDSTVGLGSGVAGNPAATA